MLLLTSLIPELDMLHADRHQLVQVVWVPFDDKDLVLVAPGGGQLLPLLPVPHDDAVVVVQTHAGKLLAVPWQGK